MKTLYAFIIIFILILSLPIATQAQKEYYNWYFGNHSAMTFMPDGKEPVVIKDNNKMYAHEGCSSISDKDGNLLFYSNGMSVWNSKHELMENGDSLRGHISSAQGCIVVKQPLQDSIYYIFTIGVDYDVFDFPVHPYWYYHIIDISENNGLGVVKKKNILLSERKVHEKQIAISHECDEIKIISQAFGTNHLQYVTLSDTGIDATIHGIFLPDNPDRDSIYSIKGPLIGVMQLSINNNYLGITYRNKLIEIFDIQDFNNIKLLNSISVKDSSELYNILIDKGYDNSIRFKDFEPYGIAFSPSSRNLFIGLANHCLLLYTLNDNKYELNHIFNNAIFNNSYSKYIWGISLGPDSSLYIMNAGRKNITRLKNPNSEADSLIFHKISFDTNFVGLGFPNIQQDMLFRKPVYFDLVLDAGQNEVCEGESVLVEAMPSRPLRSISWSGPAGYYSETPFISIERATKENEGWYYLKAFSDECVEGEDSVYVTVHEAPLVELGGPYEFCQDDSVKISPKSDFASYLWSTGDTTKSIIAHESGIYTLVVENEFGCRDTAEAEVIVYPYPNVRISADESAKCTGKPITLLATTDVEAELHWSTGETTESIIVSETGDYWVTATAEFGCGDADSIRVEITGPIEPFTLSATRDTLCPGEISTLSPSRDYAFYSWSNGETTREITVDKAGAYELTVSDTNGCETSDVYEIYEHFTDIQVPQELVFEQQHIGDRSVKTIDIINNSSEPVKITATSPSSGFTILNAEILDEKVIDAAQLKIEYTDNMPRHAASSIVLTVTEPCEWTQEIALRGTSYAETVFMLDDHKSSPGETLCLPIYAKMKRDYSPPLLGDIEMTFSHYHDLFKSTEILTGSILSSDPTPDSRVTRFSIPQIRLTPEFTVVGEICGNVYLGSATLTPLELSLADWGNELIYTEYIPGSLLVESCVEHISDIQEFAPLDATITPNPTASEASVAITGASGITHLELISPTGDILRSETLNISSDIEKVNIDLSGIASGIYYMQVRSGSAIVTKKLSVVR